MIAFAPLVLSLLFSPEPTKLIDLSEDSRELKESFNQHASQVRMILILSPG